MYGWAFGRLELSRPIGEAASASIQEKSRAEKLTLGRKTHPLAWHRIAC
jgi:hypothetical protein